jgi:hypothetical protein
MPVSSILEVAVSRERSVNTIVRRGSSGAVARLFAVDQMAFQNFNPHAARFHPAYSDHGVMTVYHRIDIELVIGFLARNGDGGDAFRQSFQIEMPVG